MFNEFLAFVGFFSKRSVPYLMQLMPFIERTDRLNAMRHRIAYIAQDDSAPIAEFLRSDDTGVLVSAVAILGIMKASGSDKLLEPLGNHPEERVRLEVIETLGSIKEPGLVVKYMTDPSQEARIKALRILGRLKYPQVYPVLLDKIKSKNFLGLDFAEQREYFNYLTANADHNLVQIMKGLLYKRKWFGRKKYRVIRRLAATALGQIASEQSLEILRKGVVKKNKDIKSACETALKGIQA